MATCIGNDIELDEVPNDEDPPAIKKVIHEERKANCEGSLT
jgi:hypothetical protein